MNETSPSGSSGYGPDVPSPLGESAPEDPMQEALRKDRERSEEKNRAGKNINARRERTRRKFGL